jgi:hypothetical protein
MKALVQGHVSPTKQCSGSGPAWPIDGAGPHPVPIAPRSYRCHGFGGQRPRPITMDVESLERILQQLGIPCQVHRAVCCVWSEGVMEGEGSDRASVFGLACNPGPMLDLRPTASPWPP